jgi:cytochrome c
MSSLVPRDIPLPLPAPEWMLQLLLIFSFALHIIFVNLMVGGQIMTFIFQCMGIKEKKWDELAHAIAKTVTVNKSVAVVLGVGPLLCLNVLYTSFIYSANALTGTAWMMLVPLITLAFLLTYLHKYSWKTMSHSKGTHIAIGGLATALFLFIPFIFLTNMNLMLFPEKWSEVKGFLSALLLPNVFPRYFHFIAASITVTALFLLGYLGKRKYCEDIFSQDPDFLFEVRRKLYGVCFVVTVAQFIIGPLVLFTLPSQGITFTLLSFLGISILFIAYFLLLIYREFLIEKPIIGKNYARIVIVFTVVVAFMINIRHLYREQALSSHKATQQQKTQAFVEESAAAVIDTAIGKKIPVGEKGKHAFEATCGGCHAMDKVLLGPPIKEIQLIYKGNPNGIISWAKAPGKKRDGMSMPSMAHIADEELKAIAEWMLSTK